MKQRASTFEKINKMSRTLAKLTKRKKIQINNIRGWNGGT
jgi:hypothetical protein